jgi:two-component system sensor histidine kinase UhpB
MDSPFFTLKWLHSILMMSILYLQSTVLYAQSMDSLRLIISTTKNTKAKIDALNGLAYEFRRGDKDSGMYYTNQAFQLSKAINYHTGFGDHYDCLGAFLFYENQDSAIGLFRKAIEEYELDNNSSKIENAKASLGNVFIAAGHYDSALMYTNSVLNKILTNPSSSLTEKEEKLVWLYHTKGNIFYYKSYYDSSLYYAIKGLGIADHLQNRNAQSLYYNLLANNYTELLEYEKAIPFQEKAIQTGLVLKNFQGVIINLSNLADNYVELNNYDLAQTMTDSAYQLAVKHKLFRQIPHNYSTYGTIQFKKGNFQSALKLFKQGIEACTQYENDFIKGNLFMQLGETFICLNKHKQAIPFYKQAIALCEEDLKSLAQCYHGLSSACQATQDFKQALLYTSMADSLEDAILNNTTLHTIHQLKLKYETERKEHELVLLGKEKETFILNASKDRTRKQFAYAGLLLLLVFGAYTYYRFLQRKRLSQTLTESLIELRNTQQELFTSEQEKTKEQLRVQISRDIHDDLGSSLSKISFQSELLTNGDLNDSKKLKAALSEISVNAHNAVNNLSEIIWSVNPKNDTIDSLASYMQNFGKKYFAQTNIEFVFLAQMDDCHFLLKPTSKRDVYLVYKEALHNIFKYAQAQRVTTQLTLIKGLLCLKIEDNGVGFEPDQQVKQGNGLENMKARAELMGAQFELVSSIHGGCQIELTVQL